MASSILTRPALGRVASLGSLYDARTDTFVELSLFRDRPPPGAVKVTQNHSINIGISKSDSYEERFHRFDIDAEMSASILAGLVSAKGAGLYLSERRQTHLMVQSSLHYKINTVNEELNFAASGVKECLAFDVLETDAATHVVVSISWGACCVLRAKRKLDISENRCELEAELEGQLGGLRATGKTDRGDGVLLNKGHVNAEGTFDVTVFGDVLPSDGLLPTNIAEAQTFIRNIPEYIAGTSDGRGQPLTYTLMPLTILGPLGILEIKVKLLIHQINSDCLQRYVRAFDEIQDASQKLHDYHARLRKHGATIPPEHIASMAELLAGTVASEARLQSDYKSLLGGVRAGRADVQSLWDLLGDFLGGPTSPQNVLSSMKFQQKMDFEDQLRGEGALVVSHQNTWPSTLLTGIQQNDAFLLNYTDRIRHDPNHHDLWTENLAVFREILRDQPNNCLTLAVDCGESPLEQPYISHKRNGRTIVGDVVAERKVLAANCIMRCRGEALDRTLVRKPVKRRAVKVACPGPHCDRRLQCTWICGSCHSVVEYGVVDNFIYCDCGACVYHAWEFRCKDPRHGSVWARYDDGAMEELLNGLEPFEELNILILGETGVGKSTWINAFVNYLTHPSLDNAIQSDELKQVIPCSFQTQLTVNGKFEQKEIRIGSSELEKDGSSGQSATQKTSVYAVDIGNLRVRLIDTPGIGDTRGFDQDNENMADILGVLRVYDKLHGILILLKPNSARLTIMFRFCIKQLLTHLHRNAARNIAFGFTNTRGSNYKPGDTFKPLESLLGEHKEVDMSLSEHNVYCFDSESFRYLAALKKGVDMGYLEDNRRSWEYSVAEAKRLVTHFQSNVPHQVRSTINLNEARSTILRLAEPMARLAKKMKDSVDGNADQVRELECVKLTRQELEQRLFVQRESLESYGVDKPRTVCTHTACVEVRSDIPDRQEATIIYKTICHRPCRVTGVERNLKGHPDLRKCWAIDSSRGTCKICGHSWMDHMHVYYEYRPKTYQHRDEAVDRSLAENASDIQLKEKAIRMKKEAIEEFETEHRKIQEAAIRFGFFLKQHAITPYNDATVEYIDMLIDAEKAKAPCNGRKATLRSLNKYRANHIQKASALEKAMKDGDPTVLLDDVGVGRLVESLYCLRYFGEDLRRMVKSQERAAETTYRERSYNISAGAHWQGSGHQNPRASTKPCAPQNLTPGAFFQDTEATECTVAGEPIDTGESPKSRIWAQRAASGVRWAARQLKRLAP